MNDYTLLNMQIAFFDSIFCKDRRGKRQGLERTHLFMFPILEHQLVNAINN